MAMYLYGDARGKKSSAMTRTERQPPKNSGTRASGGSATTAWPTSAMEGQDRVWQQWLDRVSQVLWGLVFTFNYQTRKSEFSYLKRIHDLVFESIGETSPCEFDGR